jgi:DNA-binding MarR family transcriptional regulator
MDKEDIHILRLMGEIERDGSSSQRELSQRLDLSLGLVNTFLKRLVNKGYFKVTTLPRNRVKYLLTPQGLAQKSKLTVKYLRYSVNFYKDVKKLLLEKFGQMENDRISSILFFGSGEVAELAYLYLNLSNIGLAGVIDEERKGRDFFGIPVLGLDRIKREDWDAILLTHLDKTEEDIETLTSAGVPMERIAVL